MAKEGFAAEGEKGSSFSIQYEARAGPKMDRLGLIDAIATKIPTPPHTVNLTSPQWAIVVQVVKNIGMVGLVPNWGERKRYNLRLVGSLEEGEEEET